MRAYGRGPDSVKPVGEGSNGCAAFKLRIGDLRLKCYECATAERARMVRVATDALQRAGVAIPLVHHVVEHWVLAEWVEGVLLTQDAGRATVEQLAEYLARIHNVDVGEVSLAAQRFVHLEWLVHRMNEAACKYVSSDVVMSLSGAVTRLLPPDLRCGVVQPDFIRSNIVKTPKGELVSIDNEFLGIGLGREFDVLNASRVLSGGDDAVRKRFLAAYGAAGDLRTLQDRSTYWDICYLVKLAGKRFLLQDHETGRMCMELLEYKIQECDARCRAT